MLGSHLDGSRSCLDDSHLSLVWMVLCLHERWMSIASGYQTHALVRHVWTNNNGCRHQHVQWVEMVSRILTSRSREGQAKLGGMATGDIRCRRKNPFTRNRTRDHLISAKVYSQMLYQLSYERCYWLLFRLQRCYYTGAAHTSPIFLGPLGPLQQLSLVFCLSRRAGAPLPPSFFFLLLAPAQGTDPSKC